MKKQIIEILYNNSLEYSLLKKELQKNANFNWNKFQSSFSFLREKNILKQKTNMVFLSKSKKKLGTIKVSKNNYGFISPLNKSENSIFIPGKFFYGALDGDFVFFSEIDDPKDPKKQIGKIKFIVERNEQGVIGMIVLMDNEKKFIPDNNSFSRNNFLISEKELNKYSPNTKVAIKILNEKKDYNFNCEILKVFGNIDESETFYNLIKHQFLLEDKFTVNALNEIKKIVIDNEFEINTRKDFRDEFTITIDGSDAKDLDDAISIRKNSNNNFILGVHIADVSYFISKTKYLYNEAYQRGTSTYFLNKVIPMLPEKLSNDLCSLNPNSDKLTISCIVEIDNEGSIINYSIVPSIINSNYRLTYNYVNEFINSNEKINDPLLKETLNNALNLSSILQKKFKNQGKINFAPSELKIKTNDNGNVIDINKRSGTSSEKLIENFMVLANSVVASLFSNKKIEFIYRIHEKPKNEKMIQFSLFASKYNAEFNATNSTSEYIESFNDSIKKSEYAHILEKELIKAMEKAIYSTKNIGHFGLGIENYTHFTSPIRRFPDLIVHLLIREIFFNKKNNKTLSIFDDLDEFAKHCSDTESNSTNAERKFISLKIAKYMEQFIGDEFAGIIESIKPYGMYLELSNGVDGFIDIKELQNLYQYDESTNSFKSKLKITGKKVFLSLGKKINVVILGVNLNDGKIDLTI